MKDFLLKNAKNNLELIIVMVLVLGMLLLYTEKYDFKFLKDIVSIFLPSVSLYIAISNSIKLYFKPRLERQSGDISKLEIKLSNSLDKFSDEALRIEKIFEKSNRVFIKSLRSLKNNQISNFEIINRRFDNIYDRMANYEYSNIENKLEVQKNREYIVSLISIITSQKDFESEEFKKEIINLLESWKTKKNQNQMTE